MKGRGRNKRRHQDKEEYISEDNEEGKRVGTERIWAWEDKMAKKWAKRKENWST